jgi:hypothetical protein
MAYHDFYAEIVEIDPALSREENCLKLREALSKWKRRHGRSDRIIVDLIQAAISIFGHETKYRAFREQWEQRRTENSGPSIEERFADLVRGAAGDGKISAKELEWLLEEAKRSGVDESSAHKVISGILDDMGAVLGEEELGEEPVLDVFPRKLFFGELETKSGQSRTFLVRNQGGGVLNGNIARSVPWISVDQRKIDSLADSLEVSVSIVASYLPSRPPFHGEIVIDTNGGRRTVAVNAVPEIVEEAPLLEVSGCELSFADDDLNVRATKTFVVRSRTKGRLLGTIDPTRPWIHVHPRAIGPTDEAVEIHVSIDVERLPKGAIADGELVIESNGGRETISVRAEASLDAAELSRFRAGFSTALGAAGAMVGILFGMTGKGGSKFAFVVAFSALAYVVWRTTLSSVVPKSLKDVRIILKRVGGPGPAILLGPGLLVGLSLLWSLAARFPITGGLLTCSLCAAASGYLCSGRILALQSSTRVACLEQGIVFRWRSHIVPSAAFVAALLLLLVIAAAAIGIGTIMIIGALLLVAAAVVDSKIQ